MNTLFVMNAQNAFLSNNGSVYLEETAEILKVRLTDYISSFKGNKIFFREIHSKEDKFFLNDKTHSIATTSDVDIHESVKQYADKFFDKKRYNAFYQTRLASYLRREKIKKVSIVGVETHTSVLFTAAELRNRGYDVTVVEPCTASRDTYMHNFAISLMANFLAVKVSNE